jgi:hypothetical protein
MLGRLEMDVDQCITAYMNFFARVVLGEIKPSFQYMIWNNVKPRIDSDRLENAIRKLVSHSGASETDLFDDGTERACRT